MMRYWWISILLWVSFSVQLQAKEPFRVMFYNVENFFDTFDDSTKNDNDFLPDRGYYWTPKKFENKKNNIARVIAASADVTFPAIIGLCEVENAYVLKQLIYDSPLKKKRYRYVHFDSPDRRGIDVAMLYNPKRFTLLESKPIRIKLKRQYTRDVLYVKGLADKQDTLHAFVVHPPSRIGGEQESQYKRVKAMQQVRNVVDSILSSNAQSRIVIMGDFNDYPTDKSIIETLGAKPCEEIGSDASLYNLFYQFINQRRVGTHKYQGEWGVLDQIIVSSSLLADKEGMYTSCDKATIFKVDFMMEEDKRHMGLKPLRTYNGRKYLNGFSDHLPVYVDFEIK